MKPPCKSKACCRRRRPRRKPPPAPPPEEKASEAPGLRGLKRAEVAALIAKAIDDNRIDLYLQPIVTLPQRKVRYYEAMARLRTADGDDRRRRRFHRRTPKAPA